MRMNTTRAANSPSSAAILLASWELPAPGSLTAAQVRGAHCVWCNTRLEGGTAVDLGQRYEAILGVVGRWFPRGCCPCTLQQVLAAVKVHRKICEQCTDDPTICDVQRTLHALAPELRR